MPEQKRGISPFPHNETSIGCLAYSTLQETASAKLFCLMQTDLESQVDGNETVALDGDLVVPRDAHGLVIFAHGSGSSRFSSRNRAVAGSLQNAGLGTLLFDLLTEAEEQSEQTTRHLRFNIPLLAERLVAATHWASAQPAAQDLPIGYFGSSTGAAAALIAAAKLGMRIGAVVSRGGRPDLAVGMLRNVTAPTLFIVGERDEQVIGLNQEAYQHLRCEKRIVTVPKATHLFEEPGALEKVAEFAGDWFRKFLPASRHLQH